MLSLLIPGAGQIYCGKGGRGGTTLSFVLLGIGLMFVNDPNWRGNGIVLVLVLWVFAFLDAYFTAAEINRGIDDHIDGQNPRVAVALNLVTAGLGYFYLGERAKGFALFAGMNILRLTIGALGRYWAGLISAATIGIAVLMAADAYRIARKRLREMIGPEQLDTARAMSSASRLPAFVPIALACVVTAGLLALMAIGLATATAIE